MIEKAKKNKVFVGLSGGVDSSVSALLLKEAGFDVTGVFIKVWQPDFIECTWRRDMQDAMRICAKLEIPFLLCNAEQEYKQGVIDYMIAEYKLGRTPNPDVMCNKNVKFKAFLDFAKQNGADFIATGHYAQNFYKDQEYGLYESEDQNKDQTYFLWNLNQDILEKTKFPVGHLTKDKVRSIAENNGLVTAEKKDSQGLCFVGNIDMKEFLKNFIEPVPGDVLDENNNVIGKHQGAIFYTIGERHGFEIFEKGTNDKPFFVSSKDIEKNTITVSHNKTDKDSKIINVHKLNFISNKDIVNKEIQARIRYRQPLEDCKIIEINNDLAKVEFENPQESVTEGQSLVFYHEKECFGGGIIS